jgi:hypothetical protein
MTSGRSSARALRLMLRARWPVFLSLVMVLLTVGCRRKPTPHAQSSESNHDVQAAVTADPIPLEPPVETLRVPNSGFPCAVDDLLAAKCRRCHTVPPRHNAPFALLTWDDAHAMIGDRLRYVVMASVTQSGYMPYNIPTNPPVERLTEAEKKIIADWVEAGAPKAACPPVPAASGSLKRHVPQSLGSAALPKAALPKAALPKARVN